METKRVCIGMDCKGAGAGTGRALFSTFDVVDRDGDVTARGAFGSQTAKLIGAHDWKAPNIGAVAISENSAGAVADFSFYLQMQSAKEWYESLKGNAENGVRQEWSYGFNIIDSERGTRDGKAVRILKLLEVIEVSPVVQGAGIGTQTLALKHCTNCGGPIEPPIIEPKHACSCQRGKARIPDHLRFDQEFFERCMARVNAAEARAKRRGLY